MICPYCYHGNTKVLESRLSNEKSSVRRRRECEGCQKRFTTYERVENTPLLVVKKSKSKEQFSKEKLYDSIKLACANCNIENSSLDKICSSIEMEISLLGKKEITAKFIGEQVLLHLHKISEMAYLRYLSVFKEYQTIDQLYKDVREIDKIPALID